jgi:hypothetical protein
VTLRCPNDQISRSLQDLDDILASLVILRMAHLWNWWNHSLGVRQKFERMIYLESNRKLPIWQRIVLGVQYSRLAGADGVFLI